MSLGGYGYSQLLHDAVKFAYESGVLIVAAAGNDNTNMKSYPAAFDEVIAVSATDQNDYKASFSNWGEWIELAAPGVHIFSTMPTYHVTLNDYGFSMYYDYLDGTSMACPHVVGVAALVWSLYPNKTRDWVRLWLRYSADDVGDAGFDVYYGYGRVNARNALERSPPMHELVAFQWVVPPYLEPGASGTINATILNFGENNETNITVQLLANDSLADSEFIEFLGSGATTVTSLEWLPMVEGLYNITLHVEPVLGEEDTENNVLSTNIYVGFPVKAVVLHSAGNIISDIIANWQVLNQEWNSFGDTMIYIDYTTLNKDDISYEDIASTNADVLIISCAFNPYMGWEFTDDEIESIKRYVYEGHGLIVTAGTFYNYVPNNNKLAPLLGINETTVWDVTGTDLLHLQNVSHPIFRNVPNPLVFPEVGTAFPSDGRWDSNELAGGKYLALGHFQESAIVAYRGLVYISPWLEIIPAYYHHHLQLLYNAITWSRYQKPQHELTVSLEAPKALKPNQSTLLNATVSNVGLNNESDVELQLLIDGILVNSTSVPELSVDASYTLSYNWTPTDEGIYNVTAYAPPVIGEDDAINNIKSSRVLVSILTVALFQNYNPWGYPANQKTLDQYGVPYIVFRSSDFGRVDLTAFSKVVIASDQDQAFYNGMDIYREWFEDYVRGGGVLEIHAADWGWNGGGWIGLLPGGLQWTSYYGQYVTIVDSTHDVVTRPNIITDMELDEWNYAVHGYFSTYPADSHVIIVEDYTRMPAYLEFGYGSGFIIASSQTLEWAYMRRLSLILENSLLYKPVRYEHDIAVSLDVPPLVELGTPAMLNVTVRNRGLNNETDVELYLLINGTIVGNALVSELLVGESYTINYVWTSTAVGNYNITAYAPSVPYEEYSKNNIMTKKTIVFFYMRLYLPHEWVGGGDPMGWHADDSYWEYTLPFEFPFYGTNYRTIYISSNGLITFIRPDTSCSNSVQELARKLAIAPAWDDWVTYEPYDIYVWQNSTHVGIRWYVAAYYNNTIVANFEATLCYDGTVQFNYEFNNGPVSATIGISNSAGHIIAEDATTLNGINSIKFLPFPPEHELKVTLDAPLHLEPGESAVLNATVENLGLSNETNVELQLLIDGEVAAYETLSQLLVGGAYTLHYEWTPTIEGAYNVTAYAVPVENELSIENNLAIKYVHVRPIKYVLFDQTHGTDYIRSYYLWINSLENAGFIVNTHASGSITPEVLEGYNVLVIVQARDLYTPSELSAMQRFVSDGGGLLVIGDDSPEIYTNLTTFAGITWALGGVSGTTTDITMHPVTLGVNSVYLACPIATMFVSGAAHDIIRDPSGDVMLAVSEYDCGKVIGFADENSLCDYSITMADNLLLACNMMEWLSYPTLFEHEVIVNLEAPHSTLIGTPTLLNATVKNIGLNNETNIEMFLMIQNEIVNSTVISILQPKESITLTHLWIPMEEGIYNITAYSPPVPSEANLENNMATKMITVQGIVAPQLPSDRPSLYVDPPITVAEVGNTFTVAIKIFNLTDAYLRDPNYPWIQYPLGNLYGFDVQFSWDPNVLQYVSHAVTVPVENYPEGILHSPIIQIVEIVNESGNIPGAVDPRVRAWFVYASLSPAEPFNNPGNSSVVFYMTFRIVGSGVSTLEFVSTDLADAEGEHILFETLNGIVVVGVPQGGRDIAITNVTCYPNAVYQNNIVNVTVTASNLGNVAETFNITVYGNTTIVGSQTVFDLASGENITLGFLWNTTSLTPGDNIIIWAEASLVPNEVNTENNVFTDGQVKIKMVGDINGDGEIGILDITIVAAAYRTRPGDPMWNPEADLAEPLGYIDIYDIVTVASRYGITY